MHNYYHKKTKIIATVGPASNTKEMICKLVESGADVLRLNFSHGTHDEHAKIINIVKELNHKDYNIGLLQDLQGPKIRVGLVKNNAVELKAGQQLIISTKDVEGNAEKISTTYKHIVKDLKSGDVILMDDGNIELQTVSTSDTEIITTVIHGGILQSRKGINLPDSNISIPSLTKKDMQDLEFGLQHDIDWIALSFVRKKEDIEQLRKIIKKAGKTTKIIAKIEKPEALKNIESIIKVTDAIMIARGDLGVEIAMEEVPSWQKKIVKKCNRSAKPVIIATQMMESMIKNPRPTRAETNDVANAVIDGADTLMLSAESASGNFPDLAVKTMSETIEYVEGEFSEIYNKYFEHFSEQHNIEVDTRLNDLLISSSCRLAEKVQAKAIVCLTKSGYTALRITMHRSRSEIFVFTNNKNLLHQMKLVWGVQTYYFDTKESIDETIEQIREMMIERNIFKKGDIIVYTASMPQHWDGHTNMMKVEAIT